LKGHIALARLTFPPVKGYTLLFLSCYRQALSARYIIIYPCVQGWTGLVSWCQLKYVHCNAEYLWSCSAMWVTLTEYLLRPRIATLLSQKTDSLTSWPVKLVTVTWWC